MECKFCNTQNPDQAVYCKNCGKRLDGTTQCPACGGQISADDTFCIFCGANVKKPAHALVADETAIASAAETADMPLESEKRTEYAQTAKKVLNYVANGTAILTAVLALIFVFFIGVSATVLTETSTVTTNLDINHFFHDGYKQIESALKNIKDYNDSLSGSQLKYADSNYFIYVQYVPLVFSTVILAGTIIAVITLSVLATVRSVQNLLGKTEKSGSGYAVAAFMAYALGSALITAVYGASSPSEGIDGYVMDKTTKAGVILLAVFVFIMIACKTAAKGRRLLNKDEILKCSFALGGIALLAVVMGVASLPLVDLKGDGESAKIGINSLLTAFSLNVIQQSDYELVENVNIITALAPCVFVLTCCVVILAAVSITKNANNISGNNEKGCLALNIALVCVSVVQLVLTIVFVAQLKKGIAYVDESDDTVYRYAVPIVILVFSVLALIENIVYRAMKRPLNPAQNED
ncbi:MAG: zinc ribbon domain-containing protein [Clostridia bacterium]|nr:zinc ribbon domain-containing protein [Clostridia bacterium]